MADICPTPASAQNVGLYWSNGSSGLCRFEKGSTDELARYAIEDKDVSAVIAKGTTQSTSISFSSFSNHQYRCTISLINSCGEGQASVTESSVIIQPTPTSGLATPSATLIPTQVIASPTAQIIATPTIVISPSARPSATVSVAPTVAAATQNTGSLVLAIVGIIVLASIIIGLILFVLRKKPGSESPKAAKNTPATNDASGTYYVKPYKLEDDGKAMWLILSQGEMQILGLFNGSNVVEGYATIKGIYEEADGVRFVEIEALTPVPEKK